jgi:hypothetical protein
MLMPTIPGSFAELPGAFRGCFTAPIFTTFTALCAGLLAQPGPGTVCGMLTGARLAGSRTLRGQVGNRGHVLGEQAPGRGRPGRNRRRLAVQRTVPFGLCCHSLLMVWYALHGHPAGDVATRRALAPWYRHKHTPSTLDMLVAFRRTMLTEYQHTHPAQPTSAKLTDALLTWDLTAA